MKNQLGTLLTLRGLPLTALLLLGLALAGCGPDTRHAPATRPAPEGVALPATALEGPELADLFDRYDLVITL